MSSALIGLVLFAVAAHATAAPTASVGTEACTALKAAKLPDVTIETAEARTDGTFKSASGEAHQNLPPFCRVVGFAAPTPASHIGFEVWLPLEGWNGRYVQVGNGGLAGVIFYLPLAQMLSRHYATAATDNGHQASPVDGRWAIGQPERVKDFGYRAVHLTRTIGATLTERMYAAKSRRHYFYACSEGGREAHMEAERFPEDFDGIVAGAPANDWVNLLAAFASNAQAVHGSEATFIPERKLAALQKASIAACDMDDGVQDGLVSRPSACRFDPASIVCRGEDADSCLTSAQAEGLNEVYRGWRDPKSKQVISPGYAPGAEAETSPLGGGLRTYVLGSAPGQSVGILFANGFWGGFVFEDASWDWRKFDLERDLPLARSKLSGILDATNPDRSAFARRGGKFLQYHGGFDGSIPPEASTRFYDRVAERMGGLKKTQDFYRLFMAPGVLHCGFGPGPNAFGALGIPAPPGPDHDVLAALQAWVEEGRAPARIIATKFIDDDPAKGVKMTRPLCAYPEEAVWDGRGDTHRAESFRCAVP